MTLDISSSGVMIITMKCTPKGVRIRATIHVARHNGSNCPQGLYGEGIVVARSLFIIAFYFLCDSYGFQFARPELLESSQAHQGDVVTGVAERETVPCHQPIVSAHCTRIHTESGRGKAYLRLQFPIIMEHFRQYLA